MFRKKISKKILLKTNKITRKNKNLSKSSSDGKKYILFFLNMLNTIKIYHWKTSSYSQHKATDELYTNINSNIDKFIEVYLGKNPRVDLTKIKSIPLNDFNSISNFKNHINDYKKFLISISLSPEDADLLTIRDELLLDLNQFLYLLTLK